MMAKERWCVPYHTKHGNLDNHMANSLCLLCSYLKTVRGTPGSDISSCLPVEPPHTTTIFITVMHSSIFDALSPQPVVGLGNMGELSD